MLIRDVAKARVRLWLTHRSCPACEGAVVRASALFVTGVLLAAMLVGAWSRQSAASSNAVAEFMPLAAGKQWTYRELGPNQIVTATEQWRVRSAIRGTYKMEIQTLRFDSLAKYDTAGQRIPAINEEYLILDANGIARTESPRIPQSRDYIIRNPVAVGTTWGDERNRCRISAVGVTDETWVGSAYQDCIEVTCESGNPAAVSVVSRFARGIGLVSQRVRASEDLLGGAVGTDVNGLSEERGAIESILVLQNAGSGGSGQQ